MIGVVIRRKDGLKSITRFGEEKTAKEFARRAQEIIQGIKDVNFVNCKDSTPPPKGFNPKPPIMWCPYCATERRFKNDTTGYRRCEICGISDKSYYVKIYNNFTTTEVKKGEKGRVKSDNR